MQCEREVSNFQAQPRAVFQWMRGKAAKGTVPTEVRVLVVRLRRDIGPRRPCEPLYRIVGLQARLAQPAPVNAAKWNPIRTAHDCPTHSSLPSPTVANQDRRVIAVTSTRAVSLIPHRRRRTRRQRAGVDLDHAMRNAHAVGDELLGERRWRAAVLQPVLITMPRAGHAAVDDMPFADRPVLVGAKVGECPDLHAIADDRGAFAIRRRDDAGALVWD